MTHIHRSITVNAPLEKVYALARDPQHWNDWWSGLGAPDKVIGNGEAGTVVEARVRIEETRPTVVMFDTALPDGDGWDMARTLRAARRR